MEARAPRTFDTGIHVGLENAAELVFPNDRGEVYTKNGKLEDVLRPALSAVGLARIRVHDLRHVHAAHFLMSGGSLYDLQRNLGHHSVTFTASVYGHLSQDHRVKEADRLNFDTPTDGKVLHFRAAPVAKGAY